MGTFRGHENDADSWAMRAQQSAAKKKLSNAILPALPAVASLLVAAIVIFYAWDKYGHPGWQKSAVCQTVAHLCH